MRYHGHAAGHGLCGNKNVVSAYRLAMRFQICPYAACGYGIFVRKRQYVKRRQEQPHILPCFAAPMAFCRSVFKLINRNGGNADIFRLQGQNFICQCRIFAFHKVNADICVKQIFHKLSLSGKSPQDGCSLSSMKSWGNVPIVSRKGSHGSSAG